MTDDIKINYNCCQNPAIAIFDYKWPLWSNIGSQELRINRVCTRCYAHWTGPVNSIKKYTKAEWSEQMDKIFDINKEISNG